MMMIFWAVTPLLSAIFSTSLTSHSMEVISWTSANLISAERQYSTLTTEFMMTAYGALWIGQALPAFVTDEAAMLPFTIASTDANSLNNESWTSATTTYSTSLACKPAQVTGNGINVSYGNGDGCATGPGTIMLPDGDNFSALYIGYYSGQLIDFSLSGSGCSDPKNAHTFLAFWATRENGEPNATALFCEPSYWKQRSNVTVLGSNATFVSALPLEPATPLTQDEFNITNFEYIMNTGSPLRSRRADVPGTTGVIDQTYRLQKMGINQNVVSTGMIGYAVGATQLQLPQYKDPRVLSSALEKAHKLLFALAVNSLLSPEGSIADPSPGMVHGTINSVTVNRILALSAEASLGFVIVLALALVCINRKRAINCRSDPASIGDILGMLHSSTEDITNPGRAAIVRGRLHVLVDQAEDNNLEMESKMESMSLSPSSRTPSCQTESKDDTMCPLEMKLTTAAIFVLVLVMAMLTMIMLKSRIEKSRGLPLPSTNPVVFSILTNYIPVVFATFLEPFWTLLNRILCVLKPFDVLRTGETSPSRSIYLKYTSLPPPLVIWRALRAQHLVLVAVCVTGLSTNILTVALSGLFQVNTAIMETHDTFHLQYLPWFKPDLAVSWSPHPSSESFYVAKSNISDGVPLPPWLSTDKFFIPFNVNQDASRNPNNTFRATTIGFGASLDCHDIPQDSRGYVTSGIGPLDQPISISVGNGKSCKDPVSRPFGGQNNSASALEVFHGLRSTDTDSQADDGSCDTAIMAAFFRGNLSTTQDNFKTDNDDTTENPDILAVNSLSATWMICEPSFLAANYDVTVDSSGRVQNSIRQSGYFSNLTQLFPPPLNATYFLSNTRQIWTERNLAYWHNDTFVDSWFAYFVKALSNSTEYIDPAKPVPSFDAVAPFVQETYTRIFAIMLSLNTDWLPPSGAALDGSILTTEDRLFMSKPSYIISLSLLALNIFSAVLYYATRPRRMLRRMPTTIGSVIELFAGSGLIAGASDGVRLKDDMKIGYGKYVGADGKPHIGIERRPFVVPWGTG